MGCFPDYLTKNDFSGGVCLVLGVIVIILSFCFQKVLLYVICNILTCFYISKLLELQAEGCLQLSLKYCAWT